MSNNSDYLNLSTLTGTGNSISLSGSSSILPSTDTNKDVSIFKVKKFKSVNSSELSNAKYDELEEMMNKEINSNNSDKKTFWENLKQFGLKSFFNKLDTNQDGKVDDTELNELASQDGNSKDISTDDLQKFLSNAGSGEQTATDFLMNTDTPPNSSEGVGSSDKASSTGNNNSGNTVNSNSSSQQATSSNASGTTLEEKIQNLETKEIPDCEKSIQSITQKAQGDEENARNELTKAIENDSKISQELKTKSSEMQTKLMDLTNKISDTDSKISQKDSELSSIDGSITETESQKNGLSTNSDNKEINEKNTKLIASLDSQIGELRKKKEAIQKEKETLLNDKTQLESEKQILEQENQQLQAEIAQASPEAQKAIQDCNTKIQDIQAKKTQDLSGVQQKLDANKAELIKLKQEKGNQEAKKANSTDFDKALEFVLDAEGGYSNNPNDPGGATNKGITQDTYNTYLNSKGKSGDVKNIKDEEVKEIYRQYWEESKADTIKDKKVAAAVFDAAVNCGPGTAQQMYKESGDDLNKLMAVRSEYYEKIINKNSKLAVFRDGWKNRLKNLDNYLENNYA